MLGCRQRHTGGGRTDPAQVACSHKALSAGTSKHEVQSTRGNDPARLVVDARTHRVRLPRIEDRGRPPSTSMDVTNMYEDACG